MVSVGRGGVPLNRAEEDSPCLCPGSAAAADEDLDGRTGYLSLQGREEWWFKPVGALEGGEAVDGAGQGVVDIFHPQNGRLFERSIISIS